MRPTELAISLNHESVVPLFIQIVDGVVAAIQDGRLPPGTLLPGSRTFSDYLNVSRNTVNAAFWELQARGWIRGQSRSGYYVDVRQETDLDYPWMPAMIEEQPDGLGFDLPTRQDLATSQMGKITKLSEGLPDLRLLPTVEIGKAYFRALRDHPNGMFEDGKGHGQWGLREALSFALEEWRGMYVPPTSMLVTRGNRMALNLLVRGLLQPGDAVVVEDPGNPVAWEIFKQAKAQLIPIPVDSRGIDVDLLEEKLGKERIRFVYLSPRFQIPTTVGLTDERRHRLLDLARKHRFAVLEDDSEAEFEFEKTPRSVMASGQGIETVIHLFSFSRLLAPGVRMGVLTGPPALVSRLAGICKQLAWQGDQVMEQAMTVLLTNRKIQHHVNRARAEYRKRRDITLDCLASLFGTWLEVEPSGGGLALWIRTHPALDLELWHQRCAELGIYFQRGVSFSLNRKSIPAFRLGYAAFEPEEMAEILRGMRQALPV